jgi:preprotein translocase subunit SecD
MRHIGWTLVAIVIIFLAGLYIDLPGTSAVFGHTVRVNKGIDLAGGARVLLCANGHPSNADMNTARDVINSRVSGGYGVTEPQVNRVGSNCISVEMPGLKKQSQLLGTLGKTGYLALTDSGTTALAPGTKVKLVCKTAGCAPGAKVGVSNLSATPPVMQVVVPGKYVQQGSAQVGFDTSGNPAVTYTLVGAGSSAWCTFTSSHVNQDSAIVLDNQVVSDPTIQSAICGGQTQITGLTGTTEAKTLATYLNYGALPIALHINSSEQVAASLGPQSVHEALLAGIIGLVIVALFMLLYYRLPGLLADIALIMYAAVVFALFKLLGVTLTMAGIAGFVLSIGMAVDANVLIFERMKEELRAGKTLGGAVESGFRRAFPSIRDSNASTIITTIILFWFGHNFAATVITGFATTLFLGVVISFITAVFVSHTFLRALVSYGATRNPSFYGVDEMAGGRVA